MRPWQVARAQSELRGRSLTGLERLLTRCWQLEADVKNGRAMPWLAIEQLVMEICQPAPYQRGTGTGGSAAPSTSRSRSG
jgi:DNA polymerase III delta subunit